MELQKVVRGGSPTHRRLRDRLVGIGVVTIGIDLICAALALLFERHHAHTQIMSFGTALFWTSTQLLTVSSQIQNPLSTAGRILDVAMEIYAISVVASLAGALGAFMVKRSEEIDAHATPRG